MMCVNDYCKRVHSIISVQSYPFKHIRSSILINEKTFLNSLSTQFFIYIIDDY